MGLFSGSSSAHDKLKKSVETLRKALDPKSLPTARKDKLAALKAAKEMAEKYIEKNDGAGSNMGERRLDAAQKILDLADKEIAVMEKAMTRKNDLAFNFKAWKDELNKAENANDPISKAKKASLEKLGYNVYAIDRVYNVLPEAVNSGKVKNISKEMATDDKFLTLCDLLKEANIDDRSKFYKNRRKLKELSRAMTGEDYEKILWTCNGLQKQQERNGEEEITNFSKAFLESIETANLLFGAEFDLKKAHSIYRAQGDLQKWKNGGGGSLDLPLQTIIAVNLIRKQEWKDVRIGEIVDVRRSMDELPEYRSLRKNVSADKLTEYALDGDGGRLYDSFMSQRTILRSQGKNVTKDNYRKEMREQINMETFI